MYLLCYRSGGNIQYARGRSHRSLIDHRDECIQKLRIYRTLSCRLTGTCSAPNCTVRPSSDWRGAETAGWPDSRPDRNHY